MAQISEKSWELPNFGCPIKIRHRRGLVETLGGLQKNSQCVLDGGFEQKWPKMGLKKWSISGFDWPKKFPSARPESSKRSFLDPPVTEYTDPPPLQAFLFYIPRAEP